VTHSKADWVIGVDVGGTNLCVGLVPAPEGASERSTRFLRVRPTRPERGADAVVADLIEMAREVSAELAAGGQTPLGVGIGCPGPIDREAGLVLESPNLHWTDFPLRDRIAAELDLPTTLDNDANCATYGEWWRGAARGAASVVGVTLGTGVGGGVVIGGAVVRGASGAAGELGHTVVEIDGRACPCGSDGCLEAYVAGPAIAQRARERLEVGARSVLSASREFCAADVFRASATGDEVGREVVRGTARALGAALASVVNLLSPKVVVIVGGVAASADQLLVPVRREVERRTFRCAADACSILRGELGRAAGVVGAAGVFLDDLRNGRGRLGRSQPRGGRR